MFGTLVGSIVGCCEFDEEMTEEMRAKMYS